MRFLIFGLSITSSWGNGHATVYRGLAKALHRAGAEIVFVEKEAPWYASNRDLWECAYARVVFYRETEGVDGILTQEMPEADVILVGSYFPDGIRLIDRITARHKMPLLFYDIDTPVTLGAFASHGGAEYVRADQIPLFDVILSFTGGPALDELEVRWGARRAVALYCALDPETHRREAPEDRFRCRLGYMGTYSPDREAAMEALFLAPARACPDERFILAGPQYPEMNLPGNVAHYEHVPPRDHAAFYSSCDLSLNITRGAMVARGYSPSVRLFEAAGCGACIVSDVWAGLDGVFDVGREVLVVEDTGAMLDLLRRLGPDEITEIGERALARALRDHTFDARAAQLLDLVTTL